MYRISAGNTFIAILVALFTIASVNISRAQSQEVKNNIQKLVALYQLIDYAYIDSVKMEKLVDNAIMETLKELDPHSSFIPKKEIERMEEPLRGSFEGIGITFQIFKDTILVIAPIPGGPSDRLGIMAGDKIIKINDTTAFGDKVNNQYVMDHLRGKKGTEVDVSIYRKGKKELIEYTIIRDKIPINSIDAIFMASQEVGYIKLNRFSRTSIDEFKEAVAELKVQGMTNLILDLRGNSGGYLGTAVDLADQFLSGTNLIVYTEGLKSPEQKFLASPGGAFPEGKLIVLIDEGSASASEIVSGAVQDWDRGLIIGRRSFGKGLVQRPFPLPDGSMIRLTTARYHTPTGRSIQKPYDNGLKEYYMDVYNRMKHGELVHPDSIKFPDSLKYYTPANRVVYGGGGIMPDIFIPWDSTWISDYYTELRRKGVLNQFTVQYVNDHREEILTDFPGLSDYIAGFVIDETFMKDFIAFAQDMEVDFDEEGYEASGKFLRTQIKAWMARNLWDVSASYEVFSEMDDGFLKAMEVLKDETLFKDLKIQY
ncbi:MAG: S41 family peptidase [Bacteroidales bacterium]|nr:S41 family peptidase [Bacteroidales bacterium]